MLLCSVLNYYNAASIYILLLLTIFYFFCIKCANALGVS